MQLIEETIYHFFATAAISVGPPVGNKSPSMDLVTWNHTTLDVTHFIEFNKADSQISIQML